MVGLLGTWNFPRSTEITIVMIYLWMFIYSHLYLDLAPLFIPRPFHPCSQRVKEIRSFVTQQLDLALVQALDPVVAFATSALAVLTPQQEVLHHGSAKEEQDQVGEYYSVTGVVVWLIIIAVDVR